MRQAGTGPAFQYAAAHAVYVAAAKRNRIANNNNPVWAWRVTEVRPRPGDLICKSRSNSGATYDNVRSGQSTHCDIVVAVHPGFVNVIGGNVNNSVTLRRVPTNPQGFLTNRTHFAVVTLDGFRLGPGSVAPPSPAAPNASPVGTPGLLTQESSAAGRTLYVEIDNQIRSRDGGAVRPVTGIFIPATATLSSSVDVLMYLHGFRAAGPSFTIGDLWNTAKNPHFDLREQTAAARRNMILVAPTLGSHSEAGILTQPGGLDRYLQQVMGALQGAGVIGALPSVRRLAMAAHSGGGLPMRRIATGTNQQTTKLLECWGFDCTYNGGDDTEWARWAAVSGTQRRLFIYYITGSPTARLAESLRRQGGANVQVIAAGTRIHNLVPRTHLRERIAAGPLG